MKKLIILLTTLFCLLSCEETSENEYKCLVEEKWETGVVSYKIMVSELNIQQNIHVITVGKYTYDNIQPGDTITIYK